MFAIVDIETTGGYGNKNCITEIAIVLHNGKEIEETFETLVNPETEINWYVQKMTGITNATVANAPKFNEVAEKIHSLLQNRVFIAHNVNFDYSFVHNHLQQCGYKIDLPKICTVKLTRKIFPGLHKYALPNLCQHFNINNHARHRALGDAIATAKIFEILLANDKNKEINKLTKKRNLSYLPPNLINTDIVEKLPSLPGVYYFYNKELKIVYVGKAINIKKRVVSHFSNNKSSKQKQEFLKEIYKIGFKECSSELTACIFESIEIKRLWPKFNKSQKHFERQYGIFEFEDAKGYQRLAIENKKKVLKPLHTFSLLVEARQFLNMFCSEYDIHPSLFFLSKEQMEKPPKLKAYNKKIDSIKKEIEKLKLTYLLHDGTNNYILVEQGIFWGMGKLDRKLADEISNAKNEKVKQNHLTTAKEKLVQYPENFVVQSYIHNYAVLNPDSVIHL